MKKTRSFRPGALKQTPRDEKYENAKRCSGDLLAYFIQSLHRHATFATDKKAVDEIKTYLAYNFAQMMEDSMSIANNETEYANFYAEAMVKFSEENELKIDFRRLNELWDAFWSSCIELYEAAMRPLNLAIELDKKYENELIELSRNPKQIEEEKLKKSRNPSYKSPLERMKVVLDELAEKNKQRERDAEISEFLETTIKANKEKGGPFADSFEIKRRGQGGAKVITRGAVYAMLCGESFPEGFDKIIIIDSRWPYEYDAGHIYGALNIWEHRKNLPFFKPSMINLYSKTVFVFHCEFSSVRGPTMANRCKDLADKLTTEIFGYTDQLRMQLPENMDEALVTEKYDYFPQICIMEEGYSKFFLEYPQLCTPRYYLPERAKHKSNQKKFYRPEKINTNAKPVFMPDVEFDFWVSSWINDRIATQSYTQKELKFIESAKARRDKLKPTFPGEEPKEEGAYSVLLPNRIPLKMPGLVGPFDEKDDKSKDPKRRRIPFALSKEKDDELGKGDKGGRQPRRMLWDDDPEPSLPALTPTYFGQASRSATAATTTPAPTPSYGRAPFSDSKLSKPSQSRQPLPPDMPPLVDETETDETPERPVRKRAIPKPLYFDDSSDGEEDSFFAKTPPTSWQAKEKKEKDKMKEVKEKKEKEEKEEDEDEDEEEFFKYSLRKRSRVDKRNNVSKRGRK